MIKTLLQVEKPNHRLLLCSFRRLIKQRVIATAAVEAEAEAAIATVVVFHTQPRSIA